MDLNKKNYIFLAIISFLLVGFLAGIILPLFLSLKNDSLELSLKKEELYSLVNKKKNFGAITVAYENLKEDIGKANDVFVNEKEPLNFISFLEKTGDSLGLLVQISLAQEEAKEEEISGVSFQIKVTGYFDDLMRFLEKIESAQFLTEINSLTIQKNSGTKSGDAKISSNSGVANLNINVFSDSKND